MRRRNARLTLQPQILLLNRVHFTASWLLWWWIFSALVNQSWWRKGLKPPIISAPYPTLLSQNNNVAVQAGRQAVGWGGISLRCHAYRLQSSITEITAPCCHSLIPSLGSTRQFLMLSQGKWNEKDVTWEASSDLGVSLPAVIRNYLRIVGWSFIYASRDMMMSYLYNILLNENWVFYCKVRLSRSGVQTKCMSRHCHVSRRCGIALPRRMCLESTGWQADVLTEKCLWNLEPKAHTNVVAHAVTNCASNDNLSGTPLAGNGKTAHWLDV